MYISLSEKNEMHDTKTLTFTFHYYWGAFCQVFFFFGFCPVPSNKSTDRSFDSFPLIKPLISMTRFQMQRVKYY
jgi:hypothetical protein